jgi:hypothetical protein
MGAKRANKGGGSKLTRSQTVTVRLDPKLRYLVELAARKQRRTVSSFIEWAIEESLAMVPLRESGSGEADAMTIATEAEHLWDVDDADRFARLAYRFPELLTHDEQKVWKLIRTVRHFWRPPGGRAARTADEALYLDRIQQHWWTLNSRARGEDVNPFGVPWPENSPT